MSITIDVSEAVKKLDPATLEKAISSLLDDTGQLLTTDMKVYPPPKPTYQQTGTLKRGWKARRDGWSMIIGNNTAYAPYVQDSDRQAWMHKGRWQTTRDVAEKRARDIKRLFEKGLQRWAQR